MRSLLCLVLLCTCLPLWGQSGADKREAAKFAQSAQVAMGEGNLKMAAELFQKARKKDGNNPTYQVGEAEVRFFLGEPRETIKLTQGIAKELKGKGEVVVKAVRLYGGSLAMTGKAAAGQNAIEKGLQKYPKAGELYAELGMLRLESGQEDRAVRTWEEGMRNAPEFAGNYLAAGQLLSDRGDLTWAIIYLEQYLNLQRKGPQVKKASFLLMDLFRRAWHCPARGDCGLVFYQAPRKDVVDAGGKFAPAPTLHKSLAESYGSDLELEGQMGIQDVLSMLLEGADAMAGQESDAQNYFEWLQFVASEGALEGYVFWLLQDGAPAEFSAWLEDEADTFEEFERWFARNRMLHTLKEPAVRPLN